MTTNQPRPLTLAILFACVPQMALSQIRTDGSLGPAAQNLVGPNYAILESLGKRAGNNLFHSFQTFKVGAGETATFSTTTPTIANVIGRITGGEVSTINGALKLQAAAGTPALYLVNPAGVTFGAGSSIDVPGAFYVSTADYIRFPDGNFNVDPAKASTFSTAAPEAFGFLGVTRATVHLAGANLSTGDAAFTIVAGDVALDTSSGIENGAGDLRVTATGLLKGLVPLIGETTAVRGAITLGANSYLLTWGEKATRIGNVLVEAGMLTAAGAAETYTTIGSISEGQANAGAVRVRADEALDLAFGARILGYAGASGQGAPIHVSAGRLSADGHESGLDTGIISLTGGPARGGDVRLDVSGALVLERGALVHAGSSGTGAAGSIEVTAGTGRFDGGSGGGGVDTGLSQSSTGPGSTVAGHLHAKFNGALELRNGAKISTHSQDGLSGDLGVHAQSILLDGMFSGIKSQSSRGTSGSIEVAAAGSLTLADRGSIVTFSTTGNAGSIKVDAGQVTATGFGSEIGSSAFGGSNGGVSVSAATGIDLSAGAQIRSSGEAQTGSIALGATSIRLDDGEVITQGRRGGAIDLTARERLDVSNFGSIEASTGGRVTVTAPVVQLDHGRIVSNTYAGDGNSNPLSVTADQSLVMKRRSEISIWNLDEGAAAPLKIRAGRLELDDSSVRSRASEGRGGDVDIQITGAATLKNSNIASENGAGDDSSTGNVSVRAKSLLLHNSNIDTNNFYSRGQAGNIRVEVADEVRIVKDAAAFTAGITSSHYGRGEKAGSAGRIELQAGSLWVESTDPDSPSAGLSTSTADGTAGAVTVRIASDVTFRNSYNSSTTSGRGAAGAFDFEVGGTLTIDNAVITSASFGAGQAGNIGIATHALTMGGGDRNEISALAFGSGNAGSIAIRASGPVKLYDGAQISANTFAAGNAGTVKVNAGSLSLDGQASPIATLVASGTEPGSTGHAGEVHITVSGAMSLINGGAVSSSTFGTGNAGTVKVNAGSLSIVGQSSASLSGIGSSAYAGSAGNAGEVDIAVSGAMSVVNGAVVVSSTHAAGNAGTVTVSAATLELTGESSVGIGSAISASARKGSSGQTGSVIVRASEHVALSNGGQLVIQNGATVANPALLTPTVLTVTAPRLHLKEASISSASTGNVAASNISVYASETLHLDSSIITTSANKGNGGAIRILGGSLTRLDNSWISTSVSGDQGNGGDISVTARTLALNTGFIQANTAAPGNAGGDIRIQVESLLPSHGSLIKGGNTILTPHTGIPGYNLIQAAAPDGVSGNIAITSPQIDLAGSLIGLSAKSMEAERLGKSPCQGGGSSLGTAGRGGLAPSYKRFAYSTILPLTTARLAETDNLSLAGTSLCPIH